MTSPHPVVIVIRSYVKYISIPVLVTVGTYNECDE
jgi:hypothetical protein